MSTVLYIVDVSSLMENTFAAIAVRNLIRGGELVDIWLIALIIQTRLNMMRCINDRASCFRKNMQGEKYIYQ